MEPAKRRWEDTRAQRELTLPQLLAAHARDRPDALAFSFLADGENVDTQLTFAGLDRRARTIASHLAGHAGRRAVLIYPSSADFVAAVFGCLYAGVVAVHAPLVTSTPERTLSRVEVVAGNSNAALVLSTSDITDQKSVLVAPDSPLRDLPWHATDLLDHPGDATLPEPDPGRLALIQFTSGTTGTARGIPLRHSHLTLQACSLHTGTDSDAGSVTVGWTPLFHDMGLFVTVLEPVFTGHHAVVLFPLAFLARPRRWLEAMTRFRGTISGGPNFAYDLAAKDPLPDGLDLSRWRVAIVGGEQVRPATLDRFARAFAAAGFDPRAFDPGYGLAEATCAVTGRADLAGPGVRTFDGDELRRGRAVEASVGVELCSAGCARGDQELLVVGQGTALPDGRIGELWIGGPGVADGYWNAPEATAYVFDARLAGRGPFLRTGDLAFLLDGELFLVGRIKELIIIRGRNIFPHDVEASVQASHPALRPGCGAAFAVDTDAGEALVVVQELRARAEDDPADVKRAIGAAVRSDHDIEPVAIVLLPPRSVPKTTSGKVQRQLCRRHFLDGAWPLAG